MIDVPESERTGLVTIGEDVAERLEFDRMKPWVRRIIRPKYVRPDDPAAGVLQAPPPLGVVEGSRYGFIPRPCWSSAKTSGGKRKNE